jgi:hypothetical protein
MKSQSEIDLSNFAGKYHLLKIHGTNKTSPYYQDNVIHGQIVFN